MANREISTANRHYFPSSENPFENKHTTYIEDDATEKDLDAFMGELRNLVADHNNATLRMSREVKAAKIPVTKKRRRRKRLNKNFRRNDHDMDTFGKGTGVEAHESFQKDISEENDDDNDDSLQFPISRRRRCNPPSSSDKRDLGSNAADAQINDSDVNSVDVIICSVDVRASVIEILRQNNRFLVIRINQ